MQCCKLLAIISSGDTIVLVMGLTGAGKSSFIERLTELDAEIGMTWCLVSFICRESSFSSTDAVRNQPYHRIALFVR
ncbi:hypothetical protein FOC1_g10007088 [Fusarium oxysporum f. sp. cubense race 1]|uniref:Uncharacterized protein n=1 Tax=Fusarium oxysporum f. sp. cubense (strain race 1) TaxID=1229664 RepID=N4TUM0_FUSC1|nr:hypothetical protein FOC1_g10007088 [Fusarium oxysporum f. sp. cubense race 1]